MESTTPIIVSLLVTCALAAPARAQVPGPHHYEISRREYAGEPLSLRDAVATALARNAELAALRAQLPVVTARPAQERALTPPMLQAAIWQWPINSLNPANANMYMFMLEQELPGPGKRGLRAAVAEADVASAQGDVLVRARQIVNEVKQAYAGLFIARRSAEVQLASVALLSEIADAAQAKYAAGRSGQQEALKPVVELSRIHTDIIMFDEQAAIAAARLNTLLNRVPDTEIGPLDEPSDELPLPAITDLQRTAVEQHPELQRARLEIQHAQAELAVAESDRRPDFSVQAGYQLMPNQTDGVLAQIGVTWPNAPWSRKTVDARTAERVAAVDVAKAREYAMETSVRLAVQEAYVRAQSAQERATLLRTTIVPQSQQMVDVSRIAYETDKADFQSLIDSERMLLDGRLDYARALSDVQQALADLEAAVGVDLSADAAKATASADGGER